MALDKEFDFYLSKQAEFAQQHYGEFVLIVGAEAIQFFKTEQEALSFARSKYPAGSFLVERCLPGQDHVSATFYTGRVSFRG